MTVFTQLHWCSVDTQCGRDSRVRACFFFQAEDGIRDGQAIGYHFRYDPADISRIALFRDGTWVGDGYAKELQLADGTYRHVSLAEWKMAKQQVARGADGTEGKTPAEFALVSDTADLGN